MAFRRTLVNMNNVIINSIPSATTMIVSGLFSVFTAEEEEQIFEEEFTSGTNSACRRLIEILQNKDKGAFANFLFELRNPSLGLQSLHDIITEEYKRQQEMLQENSSEKEYSTSQDSKIKITSDTLVNDLPPRMICKLIRQLNVPDSLGKDWRGIADCLNLTHAQTLESRGEMEDMLKLMVQRKSRVKDLFQMLSSIGRYDVIDEFTSNDRWKRTAEKAVQTIDGFPSCLGMRSNTDSATG